LEWGPLGAKLVASLKLFKSKLDVWNGAKAKKKDYAPRALVSELGFRLKGLLSRSF
jgi:hypothetical protein